jgi:hypothetical protein
VVVHKPTRICAERGDIKVPRFFKSIDRPYHLLAELYREFVTAGLDQENFLPYQRQILLDLENSIGYPNGTGFSTLFEGVSLNSTMLRDAQYTLQMPRVSLRCSLTTRNNLSVTWLPYHIDINNREVKCSEWLGSPRCNSHLDHHDHGLLLFRNFGCLKSVNRELGNNALAVDVFLLTIGISIWNLLKTYLSYWFNVQILAEPLVETLMPVDLGVRVKSQKSHKNIEVAVGYKTVDLIELERRNLEFFVSNFEAENQITLEQFKTSIENARDELGSIHFGRATSAIKMLGGSAMTPKKVAISNTRFEMAIEARVWGRDNVVIPFHKFVPRN